MLSDYLKGSVANAMLDTISYNVKDRLIHTNILFWRVY
jgi:hypothetical protein